MVQVRRWGTEYYLDPIKNFENNTRKKANREKHQKLDKVRPERQVEEKDEMHTNAALWREMLLWSYNRGEETKAKTRCTGAANQTAGQEGEGHAKKFCKQKNKFRKRT